MKTEAMKKAVKYVGGQVAMAAACNVKYQAVQRWVYSGCPAKRVLCVERATQGTVSRTELRPDLYPVDESAA